MKRKSLIIVSFLLALYIVPFIFAPYYGSPTIPTQQKTSKDFALSSNDPAWYNYNWVYRKNITISGAVGATTDYQVLVNVTYDSNMQSDFDDIRFTDNDGVTLLDYWLQNYSTGYALFWVEVKDDLDSYQVIWMYYGNSVVSTTSSGDDTFQEFYDKDDTAGWSTSGGLTVTTSGDYLRFYNAVPASVGYAQRTDITTSADFQYMAQYKTVSLGTDDQGVTILLDGSTSDRFAQIMSPFFTAQTDWDYYDGATKTGGAWVEGTEFIFTIQVDEGDSSNGIDYRRYDDEWNLQDSVLAENFALGTPSDCDGLNIGDQSGAGELDAMYAWIAFRKFINNGPDVSSFGAEEEYDGPIWNEVGSAEIIIMIPVDETGFNMFLIIFGLCLVPLSSMYLVWGGKNAMSTDKFLYGLIIFFLGWGLFLGGIFI